MIEISGGFHNVAAIRVDWYEGEVLSLRQYRRILKHLCPWEDCTCGGRDLKIYPEEMREEFLRALGAAAWEYGHI